MGNLIDIQSQIEKLQKQAADIRSREFTSTVQDILAKMQAFGITIKDLGAGLKRRPRPVAVRPATVRSKTRRLVGVQARRPPALPRWPLSTRALMARLGRAVA
jgi:hypothetical protein